MTDPAPVTRDGAHRAAQHELSKSIYHRNSEPLPVRVVRWVGHRIDHGLNTSLSHAPSGGVGALLLVVVVAAVVGVVIWRVGVPRLAAGGGAVLPIGRAQSAADHRSLASAAADLGNWHDAVVEQLRAVARELEERSVLEPRAGRTATELAQEAGIALPAAAGELRQAAEVFNSIAYGGSAATRTDYEVLVTADEVVGTSARSKVLVHQ